eukprot:TRINITY_DN1189_c0_g1_i1.p1 TRINITY_DN1189_c0_g1~~TRINITY_DN1189_c0_g1_i1.p1  ORF type:complete len:414 (-),score=54.23 TRINITY_DN1189_c0_g1_i1:654-1895(-)
MPASSCLAPLGEMAWKAVLPSLILAGILTGLSSAITLPAGVVNLTVVQGLKDSGAHKTSTFDEGYIRIGSTSYGKGAHLGAALPTLTTSPNVTASALSTFTDALSSGAHEVKTDGQSLWTNALYPLLQYFGGTVFQETKRPFKIYIIYYGSLWTDLQKAVAENFIASLKPSSPPDDENARTVANWWKINTKYYRDRKGMNITSKVELIKTFADAGSLYPLGTALNPLEDSDIRRIVVNALTPKGLGKPQGRVFYAVLTDPSVYVSGFGSTFCAYHSSFRTDQHTVTYALIGNPETQAPKYCTYQYYDESYYQPVYGLGIDAVVNWMGHELAEAATNPYQARRVLPGYVVKDTWLENGDLCEWDFGYYTFAANGGYYNLNGTNGFKYLIQRNFNLGLGICTIIGRDKPDDPIPP